MPQFEEEKRARQDAAFLCEQDVRPATNGLARSASESMACTPPETENATGPKPDSQRLFNHFAERSVQPAPATTPRPLCKAPSSATGTAPAPAATQHAPRAGERAQPLRLQTSLDSRVVVRATGTGEYSVLVEADGGSLQPVATLAIRDCHAQAPRTLPFYIEDLVTEDRALVRVRYDARHVDLQIQSTDVSSGGRLVQVQGLPSSSEHLQIPQAPATRRHGQGHYADGGETVARHHDASGVDLAMAGIVGAEGGFASTEGSDAGVFTWGQGQWTVTESESNLQDVLSFIKERRPDLFEHHFGTKGLDVNGRAFRFDGRDYAFNRRQLGELFQSQPAQNRRLVDMFAQAGTDPQIQRLQRQYLRREVANTLSAPVRRGGASHSATSWLTPRGLALYYSMYKNLPGVAQRILLDAINAAGGGADSEVTTPMRERASQELEQRFQRSDVKAPDPQNGNRWYAFWGEGGRQQALHQADERIGALQAQVAQTADVNARRGLQAQLADWQRHRAQVQRRESRYQKTVASLGTQSIEEPLPTDARKCLTTQPAPPQPPAPGPDLGEEDPEHGVSMGPAMSVPLDQGDHAQP